LYVKQYRIIALAGYSRGRRWFCKVKWHPIHPKAGALCPGFHSSEAAMKVLPIVVIFNFETGSELETRMDLADVDACHAVPLEIYQEIDPAVEIRAMDIPEG